VSLSHAVAKAARPPEGVPHVCYCFTPMRYAWHMRESYFADRVRGLKARLVDRLLAALRAWDKRTSRRVTHFIAISETIRKRIAESYGRESVVIYPPVDTEFYTPDPAVAREDYYLVISAFAPYKRVDLAVDACNRLGRRLVVIGSGQDDARLKSLAGPSVEFLGWRPDAELRDHLRRCRALLFPGEEDFGIVPVEANACGTPVVAYARGGATETVTPLEQDGATGEWFEEQTVDSLVAALERLESNADRLDPAAARRQAVKFEQRRYESELLRYLGRVLQGG
jgi:glycosyltransferase involved in cell wall biosynthesis